MAEARPLSTPRASSISAANSLIGLFLILNFLLADGALGIEAASFLKLFYKFAVITRRYDDVICFDYGDCFTAFAMTLAQMCFKKI